MKNMLQRTNPDPSDSAVQREIELEMLHRLGEKHPDWRRISWKRLAADLGLTQVWQEAEPDAVWKTDSGQVILAECYSRVGDLKTGHRRKLAMDTLKLTAIRNALADDNHVRCLLVVPKELKDRLAGDGWFPAALRLTTDIVPVDLLEDEKRRLVTASTRQAQGQAHTKRVGKDRTE
jgi:hypothetical protein